jgi:hypothetical protein
MALVTTFASSPLTAFFYPVWYQKKVESWRRGEIDWDTGKPLDGSETPRNSVHYEKLAAEKVKRLTVYLRLSLPCLAATQMLQHPRFIPQKRSAQPPKRQAILQWRRSDRTDPSKLMALDS